MTKDEALMLAMEAMEITGGFDVEINAIKEALAQPEQEPVAWWRLAENDGHQKYPVVSVEKPHQQWTTTRPLVFGDTPPPQRTWVGLTDEEIDVLVMDSDGTPNSHLEFARAIEAAHDIKE